MLIEPDVQAMLHNKNLNLRNKFYLITLLRKRSCNIVDGSPPLVDRECLNPVSQALFEISAGKVRIAEKGTEPVAEVLAADDAQAAALAAALGGQGFEGL